MTQETENADESAVEEANHNGTTEESVNSKPIQRIIGLGTIAAASGFALYGIFRLGVDLGIKWTELGIDQFNPRPDNPVFPLDNEGSRRSDFDRDLAIYFERSLTAYNGWQEYSKKLQPLLNTRQPKETIQLLDQIGRGFIMEGTNTLQTAWLLGHVEDKVFTTQNGEVLWINNDRYDLKNRFETQLAGTWIQTRLFLIQKNLKINLTDKDNDIGELPIEADELRRELEILTWLKQRNASVRLGDESFSFFPREEMVKVGRILQATDKLGLNLPTQIEWCKDCLSGVPGKKIVIRDNGTLELKREGKAGGIPTQEGGVKLENTNFANTLAHELGHLISNRNENLKIFLGIRGFSGTARNISERLNYVSGYAMADEMEDFAETFEEYMMNGEYFRSLLAELRISRPDEYMILQIKYNFMREVFKGEEFSYDGKPRIPILEDMEAEFAGIQWSAENRTLDINPNPNAWPNKRRLSKRFPVLQDNAIKHLHINFDLLPRSGKYSVNIIYPDQIKQLRIFPLPNNDRVQVNVTGMSFPPDKERAPFGAFESSVENGNFPVKTIHLGSAGLDTLHLESGSFSSIAPGQIRLIRDNDYQWSKKPVTLKLRAGDSTETGNFFDGSPINILDGPREIETSDGVFNYWWIGIPSQYGWYADWLSERWIGEEISVS